MAASVATIVVVRTSDANKAEISLPLTSTLEDLKTAISSQTPLGPIDGKYQRLFHLGRELKSGGRSLKRLGIGRFHNFNLHLHSTQPESLEIESDDDDDEQGGQPPQQQQEVVQVSERKRAASIIDLIDSDDEEEEPDKRQRVA